MAISPDTRVLIATLVDDLSPVRPLRSPWARFARSLMVAALLAGVSAALLEEPLQWRQIIAEREIAAHLGFELTISVLAAAAAFLLSVPAAPRTAAVRWMPIVIGSVWTVLLVAALAWAGYSMGGISTRHAGLCLNAVVAVAAMPTILLVSMVLRAAPLQPAWSGGLATAAAGGLGAFSVHLYCVSTEPAHALVSHVLPILGLGILGAVGSAVWHRKASSRLRREARR